MTMNNYNSEDDNGNEDGNDYNNADFSLSLSMSRCIHYGNGGVTMLTRVRRCY